MENPLFKRKISKKLILNKEQDKKNICFANQSKIN